MGLTRTQIRAEVERTANAEQLLDTLQRNPSQATVWAAEKNMLVEYRFAVGQMFDEVKRQVFSAINEERFGSLEYYADRLTAKGEGFRVNDGTHNFLIGKFVLGEAISSPGTLYVRCWKRNNEALTDEEQTALSAALKSIMPFTIFANVDSPDPIFVELTIYITANSSVINEASLKEKINIALTDYFNGIQPTGIIYNSSIEDEIQEVPGVKSVGLVVSKLWQRKATPPTTDGIDLFRDTLTTNYDANYKCLNSKETIGVSPNDTEIANGNFIYIASDASTDAEYNVDHMGVSLSAINQKKSTITIQS